MPDPTLASLVEPVAGRLVGDGGATVADVHHDSRAVTPASLFVAIRGARADGHDYLDAAISAGAAAVCVDTEATVPVPQLVVADTRRALAPLAAAVHGHPSRRLPVVGVTGTNGKTTVVHFLEAVAVAAGLTPGIAGTLGARIAGHGAPLGHTTPEASDFQRLLAAMVDAGVDLAAVEVSSHALHYGRADATSFRLAAFTNLSQDHLDLHGDMESYFAAKASLFTPERVETAVIWVDDPAGRRLRAATTVPVVAVGFASGDVHAAGLSASVEGSEFEVVAGGGRFPATIGLPGRFNVANALVAAACAWELGIEADAIAAGLASVERVPGRMDPVLVDGGPAVLVDYAHTPAGIAAVIEAAREFGTGRIVAVVGAGGDRDRDKRPEMGRAAAAADLVVVTTDNPRSESVDSIVAAVAAGVRAVAPERVVVEPDRRRAIRAAVRAAGTGDLVLVLGKGHEQGQDFGDRVVPFDDLAVAREELAGR